MGNWVQDDLSIFFSYDDICSHCSSIQDRHFSIPLLLWSVGEQEDQSSLSTVQEYLSTLHHTSKLFRLVEWRNNSLTVLSHSKFGSCLCFFRKGFELQKWSKLKDSFIRSWREKLLGVIHWVKLAQEVRLFFMKQTHKNIFLKNRTITVEEYWYSGTRKNCEMKPLKHSLVN